MAFAVLERMRINMTLGELVVSAFDAADSATEDETDATARWAAEGVVGAVLESGSAGVAKMLGIRNPHGATEEEVESAPVIRDPAFA